MKSLLQLSDKRNDAPRIVSTEPRESRQEVLHEIFEAQADMRPVPPGQTGEICICGAGVARGYVGLPEQTRARFVRHPFVRSDERMYRSVEPNSFALSRHPAYLTIQENCINWRFWLNSCLAMVSMPRG